MTKKKFKEVEFGGLFWYGGMILFKSSGGWWNAVRVNADTVDLAFYIMSEEVVWVSDSLLSPSKLKSKVNKLSDVKVGSKFILNDSEFIKVNCPNRVQFSIRFGIDKDYNLHEFSKDEVIE